MPSLTTRLLKVARRPDRIPIRLLEIVMAARARRFLTRQSTAQKDAERLRFFAPLADPAEIEQLTAEGRQLPEFQQMVAVSVSADPLLSIARSQTTSLDDCLTMYTLVRLQKPEIVVETGVFYGALSAVILCAMEKNDRGFLYSIDYPVESDGLPSEMRGGLVPARLRSRWQLILGDSRVELPALLGKLKRIDAFNHDSQHTTQHMTWEYETAWPTLNNGGFLSSHDVLMTPSWGSFCRRHADAISAHGRVAGLGIALKSGYAPG